MKTLKKIEIVLAKSEHVSGIVEIWEELSDLHRKFDSYWTRSKNGHRHFAKWIGKLIRSRKWFVLVALDGKQVVGFSTVEVRKRPSVMKQESYGYIMDMGVRKTHRRKGIGSKMLKEIVVWFKTRSISSIQLAVADKNLIGHSFWKKHDFKDLIRVMLLSNLR